MSNKTTNQKSIWSEFTKQYALNKTLRFELKPVGRTEDFLKQNKVFEKDKTIDDSYNQAKFYFDKLHQKFIDESLSLSNAKAIDLRYFAEQFLKLKSEIQRLKSEKKQKEANNKEKEIDNLRKAYYREIKSLLDKKAEEWKEVYKKKEIKFSKLDLEQKGADFLMKSGILGILKYEFPKEKEEEFKSKDYPSLFVNDKANPGNKVYIFDSFDRFTTYLEKFQKSRENIYKSEGENTSVITRVISNFEKFLNNKKIFEDKYINHWKQIEITEEENKIFEINYYYNCFTQDGIDKYNEVVGKINQKTKQYRDKNKIEKSELPLFKVLDKQILGEVIKERELITKTETETEEEVFIKRFKEFIDQNKKRISRIKNQKKSEKEEEYLMDDLFNEKFESEYAGIYLKKSAINTIANRWFKNAIEFLLKLPQVSKSKSKENKESPKVKPFVSLLDIKDALDEFEKERESLGAIFKDKYYKIKESDEVPLNSDNQESYWKQFLKIWSYEFNQLFEDKFNEEGVKIFWGYTKDLVEQAESLNSFSRKKEEITVVKNYCDAALRIYQMMKYFALEAKKQGDIPLDYATEFYNRFDEYYKDFKFIRYYDAIRNFVNKKPSNEDKIKLNFEKPGLLKGFAESPIGNAQYCGYILRKNNKYYLGVSLYTHFLDVQKYKLNEIEGGDFYGKLEYYSLDWSKNIVGGRVYQSFTKSKFGKPISYQEHKDEFKDHPKKHIEIIKELIKEKYLERYPQLKQIIEKDFDTPKEMQKVFNNLSLKGFYWIKVKSSHIDNQEIVERKGNHEKRYFLYLFEIVNKDFLWPRKTKNIHTLYFLNLISDRNVQEQIFRLQGEAEIFYRAKKEEVKKKKEVKKK